PDESAPRTTDNDVLLDLIDASLEDGRLLAPDGDGATAYFAQALALSSFDPRLLTRRDAIAAALVDAADVALARGDLDEAQRLAAEAFRLGAERLELARLDREIETVQGARILERHRQLLSAATAAMQEGRLLGAVGEGALASLAALRRERSTLPELSEAWQEVSEAVAANVHAAIGARDFAAAQRWAAALAVEGGDARRASDLEFEARQAEFLATPVASADLQVIEAPAPV